MDLFPEATKHRSVNQNVCDDKPLDVGDIQNFVKADACFLPLKEGAFLSSYSSHTIEHVLDPKRMISELLRVCRGNVEVICPHKEAPWGCVESKPLHINGLMSEWFTSFLKKFSDTEFEVSPEDPAGPFGDISVRVWRRTVCG